MKRRGRPAYPDVLTPREWEVLGLLREGLSNEQIAERLGITLRTAKFHVSEILSKLGVATREQAAAWTQEERPRARGWVAWPLAVRIAGALVVVAAVAGLGLLAWGVLRTSGGEDGPEHMRDRALKAMAALDSYHVEIMGVAWDIAGGDFAVTEHITVAPSSSGSTARGVTIASDQSGRGRSESVFYGPNRYTRLCLDVGQCEPWDQWQRGDVGLDFVGEFPHPRHGIAALEDAYDLATVRDGEEVGDADMHLRGKVNAKRSILRMIFPEYMISPSVRELLEQQSEFEERYPSTIDVWLSSLDSLVRQIRVTYHDEDGPSGTTEYRFSQFNEVTITPPADFIPHPTPSSPP